MPPDTARARARAGAEYLDRTEPGWWERVAAHFVDMSHCSLCVLGRLYGNFSMGLAKHDMQEPELESLGFLAASFDSPFEVQGDYYELTAAWRDEIRQRQKGKGSDDRDRD